MKYRSGGNKIATTFILFTAIVGCNGDDSESGNASGYGKGGTRDNLGGSGDLRPSQTPKGDEAAAKAEVDPAAGGSGIVADTPPNILLIVADDLGYSDLGAFGGEISTPNLDALASQGRLLTSHRAAAFCSPTRAMITSGTDSHLSGVGRQAGGAGPQAGKPGYEGYLNHQSLSIAELLRDSGYHTYIAGKWHIGETEDTSPKARGYESSYVLLPGVASFFNEFAEPPTTIQRELYRENGVPTLPPKDFYATDFYTDKLISYIEANRSDGKPFFAFAAYTAPHWPLQAPPEFIDRYRGRYDAGYDVIRNQRIERQKQLGIIPQAFEPGALLPATGNNPKSWAALNKSERKDQARRMEIYAAMVENLDANVGRLIEHLKSTGAYENTFVFFQSDNGAEGWDGSAYVDTSRSGPIDNSLANLGRKGSYVGYGKRWAEVSATPFRLWKGYTTEGGIAVPAIVRLPKQQEALARLDASTYITDLAPTFLALAGASPPGSSYKGKPVHPITGLSLLPTLQSEAPRVRTADSVLAWEHGNHRYVLRDNWKLVWLEGALGATPNSWQLYNLATDRAETKDVSTSHPEIVQQLKTAWDDYAAKNGVILLLLTARTLATQPPWPMLVQLRGDGTASR